MMSNNVKIETCKPYNLLDITQSRMRTIARSQSLTINQMTYIFLDPNFSCQSDNF